MVDPATFTGWQALLFQVVYFFTKAVLVFRQHDSYLYWPFLLSTLLIGAFAWRLGYAQLRASGAATWRELRQRFLGKALWWHPSSRMDYRFYLVNAVLFPILLGPWLFGENAIARMLDGFTGLTPANAGNVGTAGIGVKIAYTACCTMCRCCGRFTKCITRPKC